MSNAWITHVKKFAQENNKSYGCAISDPACKNSYEKVVKKSKKELREEQSIINKAQARNQFLNRVKNMTSDDEKPILKMRFNSLNESIREDIKKNYVKLYNKLF